MKIKPVFMCILLLASCLLKAGAQPEKIIRIACISNSITDGYGIDGREINSYPVQLQSMLGKGYKVLNFAVPASRLRKENKLYMATPEYRKALQSRPDIVFIKKGTYEFNEQNIWLGNEFGRNYKSFISSFRRLASHPRIVFINPVPSYNNDTNRICDKITRRDIIPEMQQVAYDNKCEIICFYSLPNIVAVSESFSDTIVSHAGYAAIVAKRLAELVTQKRDTAFAILPLIKDSVRMSSFYGYPCADFTYNGRDCKVVTPKFTALNHPWVWRARFWGHEPQADISMLERGYHIVYCDVVELYGNAQAIQYWNAFYDFLHKLGLSSKVALEGMSRGGVYVYNWAAVNPEKIACVYADNPVLDLKSWPGGKGAGPGSRDDWEKVKADYGITTEEDAMKFAGSPIDKVADIVKGNYPMLHVCGDADEVVPMQENTQPFEQQVKALHGNITVIHKAGFKHHPHSLPNPAAIVDFFLAATR